MAQAQRGTALTVFAVLFVLLAVSNLSKPFQLFGAQTGFVLFGQRLTGTANMMVGPLFALFLLFYASAIWRMKRFAMPMAHAYATYVILNLVLFSFNTPDPDGGGSTLFLVGYAVVAIGVSLGAALLLTKRKAELS